MSNTSTHSTTRRLTEGGICIALALVLSYLKIPIGLSFGGFGGSITLVMVPLILFAVRYGAPWGILAGVAFGTLKYFFAEGFAVSWVSHHLRLFRRLRRGRPCGPFPREGQRLFQAPARRVCRLPRPLCHPLYLRRDGLRAVYA